MHDQILITGGAGFVGSSLAIYLKQRFPNSGITALDNLHRRGSELNLPRLAEAGIRFVHGDIRSPEDLADLAPDLLIECSAEPSVQAGYGKSPEYLLQTNLMGCFHCLELARKSKADFVFVSTSRVYPIEPLNQLCFREGATRFSLVPQQHVAGASENGISEAFPLAGARSLYGMTKLAAELMVQEYADAYGFRHIINRCGVIAGPWQMGKTDQGVVALWAAAHYFGRPLNYIGYGGEGKQVRDLLHIADFCELIADQCESFERYNGACCNAGGGLASSASLQELTAICQEITGRSIAIGSIPANRAADVRIYITDHQHLTGLSGWSPKRGAKEILADICRWIEEEEALVERVLVKETWPS
jgi:CDP-paratose 2-epimerase